jgi:hypothetical protein
MHCRPCRRIRGCLGGEASTKSTIELSIGKIAFEQKLAPNENGEPFESLGHPCVLQARICTLGYGVARVLRDHITVNSLNWRVLRLRGVGSWTMRDHGVIAAALRDFDAVALGRASSGVVTVRPSMMKPMMAESNFLELTWFWSVSCEFGAYCCKRLHSARSVLGLDERVK